MNKILSALFSVTLLMSNAMANEDDAQHAYQGAGPLESSSPLQGAGPLESSLPLQSGSALQNSGPLDSAMPLQQVGPINGQLNIDVSANQPWMTMPTAPTPQVTDSSVVPLLKNVFANTAAITPQTLETLVSEVAYMPAPMSATSPSFSSYSITQTNIVPLPPVVYGSPSSSNLSPN